MVSKSSFFKALPNYFVGFQTHTALRKSICSFFREQILCLCVCTVTTTIHSKCALTLLPRTMPITTKTCSDKQDGHIYLMSLGQVPVVYYYGIIVGEQFLIQQLLYPDLLVSSGASVLLKADVFRHNLVVCFPMELHI